jgi:hypothetical protein
MSPEQAEGGAVDARSDLYSLGAVVYAMTTGLAPFRGGSALAVLRQVAESAPVSPARSVSEVPVWLEKKILNLMAKARAARPQSAEELEEWFATKLSSVQRGAAPLSASGVRRRWIAAAAIVVVAIAVGWGWVVRNGAGVPPPERETTRGAGLTPAGQAARELFVHRIKMGQREGLLQRVGTAPALEELIEPGCVVYHLGWHPRPDRNDKETVRIADLLGLAREFGLKRPEDAVYVAFLTGTGDGQDAEHLISNLQGLIEGGNTPAQGVWIVAFATAEAMNVFPEEQRERGLDIWAVIPAE